MLYDREQIKAVIPHRDPFLLIDEIESVDETSVTAIKYVTGKEDFFRGHFPSYPVMPGVLILEALAQAGAFVVLGMEQYKGKIALFAGADNVKWRKEVKPGDTLKLCAKLEKIKYGMGIAEAQAFVGEDPVCTATIKFAIQK